MSTPIIAPHAAIRDLQDAFGLHGVPVTKIVLTMEVGKPVMLEVTSRAELHQIEDIAPVVRRYEWVEKVESKQIETSQPGAVTHHPDGRIEVGAIPDGLIPEPVADPSLVPDYAPWVAPDPKKDETDKASTRPPC